VLFVTKCPCDQCVPLIRGAGITHIYTTDRDRDKDKGDISYLRFGSLKSINRFIVSTRMRRDDNEGTLGRMDDVLFLPSVAEEPFPCLAVLSSPCQ